MIVSLAAVLTVGFNILANALPLNGQNTGEILDHPPQISGDAGGLQVFQFFNPFGNQLNAWTYPGAEP